VIVERHLALLAQLQLHAEGFYHAALDGQWGPKSKAAYEAFKKANPVIPIASPTPPAPSTPVALPESKGAVQKDDAGMVFDARSELNIKSLSPDAQALCRKWLKACRDKGLPMVVICGTRTFGEQQALYNQGRTKPGPVVTKAKPGQSFHNFGAAWDAVAFEGVSEFGGVGQPQWNSNAMHTAGHIALDLGLDWGGAWKGFKDVPHYQIYPSSHLADLQRAFPKGYSYA
jgi:peptidoglycan L-alanyl-D-glutamate endopeptidase CwlK